TKFATVLDQGPELQKKALLRSLTEFPLRRADIYDLDSELDKTAPPIYNRIGNDIEQIVFFGESADRFAQALSPLLDSSDAEMRRLAAQAVLLVREARFADVNRIAGPPGPAVKAVVARVERLPEAAEVVRALKPPLPSKTTQSKAPRPSVKLNEAFFRGYV